MSKFSFDAESIRWMGLFEKVTRARLKDCFEEEGTLYFIVQSGFMAKAIGKKGVTAKKLQDLFKKPIRIIEYQNSPEKFVKAQLALNVDVSLQENVVVIACPDTKTKGQVFGREKEHFKKLEVITKKYFPAVELKVE